ncbi:MAG: Ig-like domain-containing protein [Candidatus Norongarragalinales archaeon]
MIEGMALNFKQKLLGVYFLVEEQYYNAVDWLENQGRYEFTDYFVTPIEEKGVPSFIVFLALALLLLLGAFFLFLQPPPTYASLEVRLYNALTNEKIDGFVSLERGGKAIAAAKTVNGRVFFEVVPRAPLDLKVESEEFEEYVKTIDAAKTRLFTARLKPLATQNANALLLQRITSPPAGAALPPLPPIATETPQPSIPWPSETASITPSGIPTPSPSAHPSASPRASPTPREPLKQTQALLAVNEDVVFEGYKIRLEDLSESAALISISNANTGAVIVSQVIIRLSETAEYFEIGVSFLGKVEDAGTPKAKLELYYYGAAAPSPTPPPAVFVRIDAPRENEVIHDVLARVNVTAWASESIESVEVSVDNGASWAKAKLVQSAEGAKWVFEWLTPASGEFSLKARAKTNSAAFESQSVHVFVSPCKKLYYNGESAQKIDVVFAPSKFQNSLEFVEAIDDAFNNYFLMAKKPFSGDARKRGAFNAWFYAYNFDCSLEGRVWECSVPSNYAQSCTMADVTAVIVKSQEYAGSATNARLLAFSSSKPELFSHELGHALFGLADRYCCDGAYWQTTQKPNLWSALSPCSEYVSMLLGIDVPCRRIRNYTATVGNAQVNWFEQASDSNMQKLDFDFDESDVARINFVLENPQAQGENES